MQYFTDNNTIFVTLTNPLNSPVTISKLKFGFAGEFKDIMPVTPWQILPAGETTFDYTLPPEVISDYWDIRNEEFLEYWNTSLYPKYAELSWSPSPFLPPSNRFFGFNVHDQILFDGWYSAERNVTSVPIGKKVYAIIMMTFFDVEKEGIDNVIVRVMKVTANHVDEPIFVESFPIYVFPLKSVKLMIPFTPVEAGEYYLIANTMLTPDWKSPYLRVGSSNIDDGKIHQTSKVNITEYINVVDVEYRVSQRSFSYTLYATLPDNKVTSNIIQIKEKAIGLMKQSDVWSIPEENQKREEEFNKSVYTCFLPFEHHILEINLKVPIADLDRRSVSSPKDLRPTNFDTYWVGSVNRPELICYKDVTEVILTIVLKRAELIVYGFYFFLIVDLLSYLFVFRFRLLNGGIIWTILATVLSATGYTCLFHYFLPLVIFSILCASFLFDIRKIYERIPKRFIRWVPFIRFFLIVIIVPLIFLGCALLEGVPSEHGGPFFLIYVLSTLIYVVFAPS